MNTKIHPWPTRKNPDTGRYEVQIQGVWRSRQYAWQLLRLMKRKAQKKEGPGRKPRPASFYKALLP